jgi:hypothetical protein
MSRMAGCLSLSALALVAVLCGGCTGAGGLLGPSVQGRGAVHTPSGQSVTAQEALTKVALGRSTKADVLSALGEAITIHFDSGHEVWVYRWPGRDETPRGATELVLLFDTSGVVTKARVRPGLASRD